MIKIDYKDLYDFVRDLKCETEEEASEQQIKLAHWYTRSDGCTGTLDLFRDACIVHDFHYRTHHDLCGRLINRAEADRRFRVRIQRQARDTILCQLPLSVKRFAVVVAFATIIGQCSPIAWGRWAVVRCLGGRFWEDKTNCRV